MSNRGFPKASFPFLLVVLAVAARPAAGEPLVLTSDISGAGSASYSRYLGADRGMASGGQSQERGLKDVFEACVRCDAGEGLDLKKSLGGIGMFGRWHGNGYSFGGSQKTWGGQSGSGSGNWNAPQATRPIVAAIAARGGFSGNGLSAQEIGFIVALFRRWLEGGFTFPGGGGFGNGGSSPSSPTPTPEPATLALVAGGLAAAAAIRRRQQRRSAL
jgi:hypothetical protein